MKNTKKKGFTLVELLVVIAILAILATVSVVGYTAFIERANESVAQQELVQLRQSAIADDINNKDFAITSTGIVLTTTPADKAAGDAAVKTILDALAAELDGTIAVDGTFTAAVEGGATASYVANTVTYAKEGVTATWTVSTGDID